MGVIFAILGGILKWILLIILGLIGLILVLLLIVLLTPLRYKIKWSKQADTMEGDVKVSWLLHLISFRLTQSGKEIKWTVKIGPKIIAASYPIPKKEKKPKKKKKAKPKKDQPYEEPLTKADVPLMEPLVQPPTEPVVQPPTEPLVRPPKVEEMESVPQEEIASIAEQEQQNEPIAPDEALQQEESPEDIPAAPEERKDVQQADGEESTEPKAKKNWRRRVTDICWKIRRIFEKIIHPVQTIREKIQAIRAKVRSLLDKWDQVKAIWDGYPQKGETVSAITTMLGGILKAPLPKKYDVKLRIGMKDPATTGQILMYYYSLTPVLFPKTTRRRRFELEADFENPVIEVTAKCKGRFSIGSFLWPVIRALLNGHIRRLIRYVLSVKKNFKQN